MKALLYSVWLWVVSDPERSLLALLALLVGTWKALPATLRASLELRFPRAVGTARMIAKLAPDVIGALRVGWYQALKAKPRATPGAPHEPARDDRAEPGFAERSILLVVGGVAALALGVMLLSGCPLPAPDGCTPFATRCGPSGIPQTCSGTQRWSHGPAARPCAELGAICCRATSPYGNKIHACVPASACLPERPDDAGAAAEGGAL